MLFYGGGIGIAFGGLAMARIGNPITVDIGRLAEIIGVFGL